MIYLNRRAFVFQFQLADRSHELILEITALRAKVTEMREKLMESDQEVREEVRRDYQVGIDALSKKIGMILN